MQKSEAVATQHLRIECARWLERCLLGACVALAPDEPATYARQVEEVIAATAGCPTQAYADAVAGAAEAFHLAGTHVCTTYSPRSVARLATDPTMPLTKTVVPERVQKAAAKAARKEQQRIVECEAQMPLSDAPALVRCPECKCESVSHYQIQTRRTDEGARNIYECLNTTCKARWYTND